MVNSLKTKQTQKAWNVNGTFCNIFKRPYQKGQDSAACLVKAIYPVIYWSQNNFAHLATQIWLKIKLPPSLKKDRQLECKETEHSF